MQFTQVMKNHTEIYQCPMDTDRGVDHHNTVTNKILMTPFVPVKHVTSLANRLRPPERGATAREVLRCLSLFTNP
jgi:hypothetical protein